MEFDAARSEHDPETVARMLITGRQCVIDMRHKVIFVGLFFCVSLLGVSVCVALLPQKAFVFISLLCLHLLTHIQKKSPQLSLPVLEFTDEEKELKEQAPKLYRDAPINPFKGVIRK